MKFLVLLLLLSCSKDVPASTETKLLIETFEKTLSKTTEQLAKCMITVNACNEARDQVDREIQAIFNLQKDDYCE